MALGFGILLLMVVIWVLIGKLEDMKSKSLMWENRSIRLVQELKSRTGDEYYFTDDKGGIEHERKK